MLTYLLTRQNNTQRIFLDSGFRRNDGRDYRSRIDVLGVLHHIIAGGIKHKRIFTDDVDRDNLTKKYSLVLKETNSPDPFRVAAVNIYRDIVRGKIK